MNIVGEGVGGVVVATEEHRWRVLRLLLQSPQRREVRCARTIYLVVLTA